MTTAPPHTPIPYLERLRAELVAAHPTTRRVRARRRRLTVGAGSLAVVAGLLVGIGPLDSSPAAADVIVTRDGDTIEVRIARGRADAHEVVAALRDAGVGGRVQSLPTGPSAVGTFLRLNAASAEGTTVGRRVGSGYAFIRFPAATAGRTTLSLGRAARPGEHYEVATDAHQPGEPLGCLGLQGAQIPDALGDIADRDLEVTWVDPEGQSVTEPSPGSFVGTAKASSDHEVLIFLTATPTRVPLPEGCS